MTKDTAPETPDRLDDPIAAQPGYDETETRIALSGHPIHAMSVAFPIALSFCLLGADLLYWWTGDPFWARAALWPPAVGARCGHGGIYGMAWRQTRLRLSARHV